MSLNTIASLSFLENDVLYQREKPFQIISSIAPSGWQTNCRFISVSDIPIRDCRASRNAYTLDTYGFEFCDWPSKTEIPFASYGERSATVERGFINAVNAHLLETADSVRKKFQANKVICFDWRVRSYHLKVSG
jgi:hypothetical protein